MKGIFRKDMLQIVLSWKVLLLVAVLVSSALVYFDAAIGLISFFPIFFAMQASSTIIADRHCGWYRFSTTALSPGNGWYSPNTSWVHSWHSPV